MDDIRVFLKTALDELRTRAPAQRLGLRSSERVRRLILLALDADSVETLRHIVAEIDCNLESQTQEGSGAPVFLPSIHLLRKACESGRDGERVSAS